MRVVKLNSNYCGGFKPPKGHLDTQMYPECAPYETNRDIVKKTVNKENREKKKKKKKKASKEIFSRHSDFVENIWQEWKSKKLPSDQFVKQMESILHYGPEKLSRDPSTRRMIQKALMDLKNTKDYNHAAESISAALSMSAKTEESFFADNQSKTIKEAKHAWPITKGKEHQNEGIWDKWLNGKVSDEDFVNQIKRIVNMGFPGITKDQNVRSGIVSSLKSLSYTGDYADAARSISSWLDSGVDIDEGDEMETNSSNRSEMKTTLSKKKKKKKWDPNPWAVCNTTVDKDKDPEKFERCVMDVKKKQAFNLKKYVKSKKVLNDRQVVKTADKYEVVDSEFNRENYPDMIGKVLDNPPAYAQVKVISEKAYEYFINLDERGEFYADVRDPQGNTVFEIKDFDIFVDGFMKHKDDLEGLKSYLIMLGYMDEGDELVKGN